MTNEEMVRRIRNARSLIENSCMDETHTIGLIAVENHLQQPANNAELVGRMNKSRDWWIGNSPRCAKLWNEIIAALSAHGQCVCDYRDKFIAEQAQGRRTTHPVDGKQPNPSALADRLEQLYHYFEHEEFVSNESKDALKQAAQQLRQQPFDVLQCLKRGDKCIDRHGTIIEMDENGIVRRVDGNNNNIQVSVLADSDFNWQPYTAAEVLEDGWYWISPTHDHHIFLAALYTAENNGWLMDVTLRSMDDFDVVIDPDTGQPWKIEQPKGRPLKLIDGGESHD